MNHRASNQGFTLIELLVGVAISMITTVVAGKVMLDQMESTKRIEGLQRQRDDWSRTNSFITSEVNLASRISTSLNVGEGNNCLIDNGSVKMVVHFARNRQLPPSIYYTKETEEGWNKNILKRCGPSINSNGDYTSGLSEDIIIDGLNAIDGFTATVTGEKLATFTINLKGLLNNAYIQKEGARARVQDVHLYPSTASICLYDSRNNTNGVKVNLSNQASAFNDDVNDWAELTAGNVLICGNGGGDTITSGDGNDQLEAGNPGASVLNGGNGDDRLLGSDDNDVLEGGNGNDILIARLGDDQMTGGAGTNHYVPGLDEKGGLCDRDTVIGSDGGYDIIYFSDSRDQYTLSAPCNQGSCRIKRNDSDDRKVVDMSGGNRLIFSGNGQEQIELATGDAAVLPPLADDSCTVDITILDPPVTPENDPRWTPLIEGAHIALRIVKPIAETYTQESRQTFVDGWEDNVNRSLNNLSIDGSENFCFTPRLDTYARYENGVFTHNDYRGIFIVARRINNRCVTGNHGQVVLHTQIIKETNTSLSSAAYLRLPKEGDSFRGCNLHIRTIFRVDDRGSLREAYGC